MEIINSKKLSLKPKINLLVYGEAGVGKTTLAATAKNAILADAEKGAGFLGSRGYDIDIVQIKKWEEMQSFYEAVEGGKYQTVILDPIGELLDKLIEHLIENESGLTTRNNTLTLQGWGIAKQRMRTMMKAFRDLDLNVIITAHADEPKDGETFLRRPKISANLGNDLEAMMDIIGYLEVSKIDKNTFERRLYVQPTDRYHAKDRTGCLPEWIEPDFEKMLEMIYRDKKKAEISTTKKSGKKQKISLKNN